MSTTSYDLLVGADGVNSAVRQVLEQSVDGFCVDKTPIPLRYISFRDLPPLQDATGVVFLL